MNASAAEIERLFHAALEQPTADGRARFIKEACGSDELLRARIDALIAAHLEGESEFLEARIERPAFGQNGEQAGERLGSYELIEELGAGAFGTVWRAKQTSPVRRQVALKIIKLGMDTRAAIARFDQERQALAILNHPNIARVFDAGATATGRPFFAMELVDGPRLTDFCDCGNLSTRERLRLFVQVCHGVQHAHQKGIIHRDLKPANILVAGTVEHAVPKIIDFGVAKATQEKLTDLTLLTAREQIIGTPHYLSPEQATPGTVDIDTRSDIYSLGVILYELLTGQLPFSHFTHLGVDELRRAIREQDPPRPSTALSGMGRAELASCARARSSEPPKLIGAIRGDLDWIVMRALDKERDRRYETASAFAADLERHLDCKPVQACPPSNVYRFRTFARRNKFALGAAAAVAISLLAGIIVSSWQAIRAKSALARLAESAPAFAQQAQRFAAEDRFAEALEKVDYAAHLCPDEAVYPLQKGDLLQCQLRLVEAADAYRSALKLDAGNTAAKSNLALCEKLAGEASRNGGTLPRESLAELLAAMKSQQRPAAELRGIALRIGEEKSVLLDYWLQRLDRLPIAADRPLKKRLTVREDGLLALDLSGTPVASLAPLEGMPLAELNCAGCGQIVDLAPLKGMPLRILNLEATRIYDVDVITTLPELEQLNVADTKVTSLDVKNNRRLKRLNLNRTSTTELPSLSHTALESLHIAWTKIASLAGLESLPLKELDAERVPVIDFSVLRDLPLEILSLRQTRIRDLDLFGKMPLKELHLGKCSFDPAGFSELRNLEVLEVPAAMINQSLVAELRKLPRLGWLRADKHESTVLQPLIPIAEFWDDRRTVDMIEKQLKAGDTDITARVVLLPDATLDVSASEASAQPRTGDNLDFLRGIPISRLQLANLPIRDLTPLAGMPLRLLSLAACRISARSLDPLRNCPIEELDLSDTYASDISVLRDLPLRRLSVEKTNVSDLSPLVGKALVELYLGKSRVEDLSPLRGMPLRKLHMGDLAPGIDLSPLVECTMLEDVRLPYGARNVNRLRSLPRLSHISYDINAHTGQANHTAREFWIAGNPASEAIMARERRFAELEQMLRVRLTSPHRTEIETAYSKLAAVVLMQGRIEEYQRVCSEMRREIGKSHAQQTLLVCLMHPSCGMAPEEIRAQGELLPESPAKMLAGYRLGDDEGAKRIIERVQKRGGSDPKALAQAAAVLAMVQCREGDLARAATNLASARQRIAEERAGYPGRSGWYQLLFAELLAEEATSVLESTAARTGVVRPHVPTIEEFWNESPAHEDELVRQGEFAEVERLVRRRVASRMSDQPEFDLLKLAALACARGDAARYRELCRGISSQVEKTKDPASLLTAAVLASDSEVSADVISELQKSCQPWKESAHLRQWVFFPGTLAAYRAGDLGTAESTLRDLLSSSLVPSIAAAAPALSAIVAASRPDLHTAQAENIKAIRALTAWRDSPEFGPEWGHWLVVELLIKEADNLIRGERRPVNWTARGASASR